MCILQYKNNFVYQYHSDNTNSGVQEKLQPVSAKSAKSPTVTSNTTISQQQEDKKKVIHV